MGSGRWDATDWSSYAKTTAATKPTVDHIYTSRALNAALDPKDITIRESRDSPANPASTAVIVALDVTGSMSRVLDAIARKGLGTLVEEIHARKPVTDPHLMIMGIGDVECDRAPLQVTQFEAEVAPMTAQLEQVYLERGGGGNGYESYAMAWLFAGLQTSIDCFEKRGKKGYLFTVGDEEPTPRLLRAQVNRFIKSPMETDLTAQQLLDMVSRQYNVFHVIVEEGSDGKLPSVHEKWGALLGQRVLRLSDHKLLSEVVVSAIEVNEGRDRDAVVKSWSGDTALVVARAVASMTNVSDAAGAGVTRL